MPIDYQVLARKWRPHNLQDMVGQEPILRMLKNALEQERIHHAYLFTGTRGVGKTTIARILAKCLNCESGVTPTPCGICHACTAIDAGTFLDLYEVDAASRTKVEDTRDLLDNVMYPPTQGRYKIYLIDEVHMLSNHSFNALLKTLEEPPAHAKFFLATTDPKRVPITILSRCLQFHLNRIIPEQITNHLEHICKAETIAYETSALAALAKAADGSMRDALSLLDQAIAYGNKTVNQQDVNAMLGNLAHDELLPLLEALAAQDGKQLFSKITKLAERAPDFQQLLEEIINFFHQIAIAQIVPDYKPTCDLLVTLLHRFTPADVQLYYQIALLGRRDLALTPIPQQGFEMTMLRMLAFKPIQENTTVSAPSTIAQKKQPTATSVVTAPAAQAIDWRELLPKLELSGMAYALAANCMLSSISENLVTLSLSNQHQPMLNPKLKERIAESLSRYYKKPMQLEIHVTAEELTTPLKQQQQEQHQQLANAKQTVLQNPKVKQLLEMYDATVEVSLI